MILQSSGANSKDDLDSTYIMSRIPYALTAIALAGVPLAIMPGLMFEYEIIPKLLVLLVASAGLALCWTTWYTGAGAFAASRHGRILLGLFALQAASLVISTFLSPNPGLALAGSASRRYGLVIQLAVLFFALMSASCVAARRNWFTTIMFILAGASGCVAAYAIAQYAGWDPLLSRRLYTTFYDGDLIRTPGTLGH